jgi:hypothetical protein
VTRSTLSVMEHVNNDLEAQGTIHRQDHNGNYANYGGPVSVNVNGWHVYAVERDTNEIRCYMGGIQYHSANIAGGVNGTEEFHNNFFLLLNLAIGEIGRVAQVGPECFRSACMLTMCGITNNRWQCSLLLSVSEEEKPGVSRVFY